MVPKLGADHTRLNKLDNIVNGSIDFLEPLLYGGDLIMERIRSLSPGIAVSNHLVHNGLVLACTYGKRRKIEREPRKCYRQSTSIYPRCQSAEDYGDLERAERCKKRLLRLWCERE